MDEGIMEMEDENGRIVLLLFFFYKEIEGKGTICKWRIRIEEYKVIEMIEN